MDKLFIAIGLILFVVGIYKFISRANEQKELIRKIKAEFSYQGDCIDLTDRGCAETLGRVHKLLF